MRAGSHGQKFCVYATRRFRGISGIVCNRSNILAGFLDECCVLSPKARVFNTDLFAAFVDYCARNGLETFSRDQFYDLLSGIPGIYAKRIRIGKENRQGHTGIALKKKGVPWNIGTILSTACGRRTIAF